MIVIVCMLPLILISGLGVTVVEISCMPVDSCDAEIDKNLTDTNLRYV